MNEKIDTTIPEPRAINIHGTITLKKEIPIGFGCANCIKILNDTNIFAKQDYPLAAVDIWIPNQKKNPQDEPTYTNWTRHALADTQNDVDDNAQNRIFPAIIPVYMLTSCPIRIDNAFKNYYLTLMFDQHQKLDKKMRQFHKTPSIIFLLDKETHDAIKTINRLQNAEVDVDLIPQLQATCTELSNNIFHAFNTILNDTIPTFIDNEILAIRQPNSSQEDVKEANALIEDPLGWYDNFYSLGKKATIDTRHLVLEHTLKRKNPFLYVMEREKQAKKMRLA